MSWLSFFIFDGISTIFWPHQLNFLLFPFLLFDQLVCLHLQSHYFLWFLCCLWVYQSVNALITKLLILMLFTSIQIVCLWFFFMALLFLNHCLSSLKLQLTISGFFSLVFHLLEIVHPQCFSIGFWLLFFGLAFQPNPLLNLLSFFWVDCWLIFLLQVTCELLLSLNLLF